jgi:hypothetical protein
VTTSCWQNSWVPRAEHCLQAHRRGEPNRRRSLQIVTCHFHDVQAGVRVRAINQLITVDEDIRGLDDTERERRFQLADKGL